MSTYKHDCKPLADRPAPHPGIATQATRWKCPDCGARWSVLWQRTGDLGEATSGQATPVHGPSLRWRLHARRAVRAASRPPPEDNP